MFSGIVETVGKIIALEKQATNLILEVESSISNTLHIDQSIAHDGVCLTVTELSNTSHQVVAIKETLEKTTLSEFRLGDLINLEKAVTADHMLDGHIVQGHVDCTSKCIQIKEEDGSWLFTFELPQTYQNLIVDKGSITINGTSLTVVSPTESSFQVAIIPYTYENTTIKDIKIGSLVNIEFDILGKYIQKYLSRIITPENLQNFIKKNEK